MGYLPPETGSPGDLERATLPAWLEAMRPLPVARPSPSTTSEYEETTGPLAGMKGIIAAEPAIALPTVRLSAAAQPAVSETHLAQARLIQALVKEEAAPHAAPRRPVARPIVVLLERWLIFAVLAIAVVAPFILEGSAPMFGHPSLFPVETVAARDVVANLPAGRPVLVAFEYEPGAAGEMDLLAGALLDHLADRGLYIVGVSTRPLGPALAQAALETSSLPLQAGETARDRYVNLGYLPGGVMALPVFAADPRSLVSGDFSAEMPDPEAPPPDVWQHSNLFNVHSLADFGLIAVLSNSPEAVRAWIEQAAIARGGIAGPAHPPMIALVSASAEPLVHPYFLAEGANSSLQGLVSGPFGATDYALLAGATGGAEVDGWPDVAAWRWDAQALGQLAAVVIIAVGALIFGSFSLLRRREERPS